MSDFATFKQMRLRQDPGAGNYSEYEWERAYKAYLSARGHSVKDGREGGGGTATRRHRKSSSSGVREGLQSLHFVPAGFRTICLIAWGSGFFVAVFIGWFIGSMGGGGAGLIGFLAGCALVGFFSALVGLLYHLMSECIKVQQILAHLESPTGNHSTTEGNRPNSESGS
jgi:hypothetical protein